ncbi:MAG TPA: N-formylglutamate amidohydrolase [Bauldia sp.]|nr:N-formylglutamate amidohydrolase [Bauldia sp.]
MDASDPDRTGDEDPYHLVAGDPACGLLLLCDHARNRLPAAYGSLGIAAGEFERHIAYDIGAEALTRRLADRLGAPAVLSSFSRLLIDINRGEDDPTLIMRLSDGAIVPGNRRVDAAERARRIAAYHAPYHNAVSAAVDRALAAGWPPILVSIHSFTPSWRGVPRPWQVGVLWDHDPRFSRALIALLAEDASLVVGDNEPYAGGLPGDTLYRHAIERGLAHAIIEVRQDLIAADAGVEEWTARLAPPIAELNRDPELHLVRHHLPSSGQAPQRY